MSRERVIAVNMHDGTQWRYNVERDVWWFARRPTLSGTPMPHSQVPPEVVAARDQHILGSPREPDAPIPTLTEPLRREIIEGLESLKLRQPPAAAPVPPAGFDLMDLALAAHREWLDGSIQR